MLNGSKGSVQYGTLIDKKKPVVEIVKRQIASTATE